MASSGEEQPAAVRVIGGWASHYSIRVYVALKLKGVEYEFLQEVVGNKSELLLKSNPVYKKIPVLLHRGKPIPESMVILQYIDEVWASNGLAILPADPYARAVERFWAQYVDDKIAPASVVLRGVTSGDKDEAAVQVSTALQHLEEAFVKCSQGKSYFGGDNIGFLDIVLGSHLGWLKAAEKIAGVKVLDESKFPELTAWADRFYAHHAVRDVMPETDKLVEFNTYLIGVLKAKASKK
ncbi:Glutathione S-transferase U17 [Dichanthelium oligosanthes]|uniref:glutathione transferase n=1 Tax=Dichanthelium oligosanthes TaxID=888268 RepID=A0A1E5VI02_9POAL|nr:Glutathione S-transferase U17 [Dichanthelium oligosanthes]